MVQPGNDRKHRGDRSVVREAPSDEVPKHVAELLEGALADEVPAAGVFDTVYSMYWLKERCLTLYGVCKGGSDTLWVRWHAAQRLETLF